jgi:hypothetical protein
VTLIIVVFGIDKDVRPAQGVVAKAWLAPRTVVVSSDPANASLVDAK